MKKILIVDASPRVKGNSNAIAEKMAVDLKKSDVEVIKLREIKVNSCVACDFCKTKDVPVCIQKDDMAGLIEKIDRCDGIILLTPIYFNYINAQAKTFIDRLYCFFNPMMPGACIPSKRDKKAAVISCCGGGSVYEYEDMLGEVASYFAITGVDDTNVAVFGGVNAPGSVMDNPEYLEKMEEIAAWMEAE